MSTKTRKLAAIEAAMDRPDTAVDGFKIISATSFTAQIAVLKLGESASRVTPIDPSLRLAEMPEYLPAARERLRNNTKPSIKQAAAQTGCTYRLEVCDLQTLSGSFYIVAIVTRVA